jgi:ribonuclease R
MTKKTTNENDGKAAKKTRTAESSRRQYGVDRPPADKYAAPKPRRKAAGKTPGAPAPLMKPPKAIKAPAYKPADNDPQAEREANRYDTPILSREGLMQFLGERAELMTADRIAEALGYTDSYRQDALIRRLGAMVRDGQLLVNRRDGYGLAAKLDLIAGTVIANPDGFGFLRTDAGGEDLFIPPKEMRAVMHGDRVLVNITGMDRRGRREAAIAEVLERRRPRLVGRYDERAGVGLVIPDDRRLHQDVVIPPGQQNEARAGQIVVAEIVEAPTRHHPPIGRVVAVLGEKLEASLIVRVAIESHGLPHEWPLEVTREAAAVAPEVSAGEREGREDIRALPLVTIDGEDARDFDDAVYCEKVKGGYRLLVAIADVSHYVKPGSKLDAEAYDRATSVYFPGFVVPMLPETLSNGICSLNPKVERLCMVCDMRVDRHGEVQDSRFYPAVMRSHARLTYTRVWRALGERDADERAAMGDLLPHLETLYELYQLMAKARTARGAIDFESSEVKFRLAANVEAALFLSHAKIPVPYRVHAPPPEEKFAELQEFLREFGLKLPSHESVLPGDYAKLIRKVRERPEAALLESVLLRSQALAVYSPVNEGHFGLALAAYAHFTSPIRRYPDLLVHRAIRHALAGGKESNYLYSAHDMQSRSTHCSERGRRADEAEREVDERYQCAWMSKHVGAEFDGIVSGVTSFGLFVQIADTGVSGLIHVTQLPNDYYHFDSARREMVGERRGLRFRLGDALRVQVLRASMEERKVDLRLAGVRDAAPTAPAEAQNVKRKKSR